MKRIILKKTISAALSAVILMGGSVPIFQVQAVESTDISSQSAQNIVLENLSFLSAESISLGSEVMMTGAASGGSGEYLYAYYYKREEDTNWNVVAYSENTSSSFKPTKETTYNVCIRVKDSKGKVAEKRFDVAVKNTLVNMSSISAEMAAVGSEIVLTGSATGGSGEYTYSYYYKKETSEGWATLKTNTTDTTASFKPTQPAVYNVCIKVTDSNGVKAEDKRMTVTVENNLTNTSTVSAEKAAIGDEIVLKGSATGGSGEYTYSYYYKKETSSGWATLKTNTTDTTASFKPTQPVVYNVCIKVTDSNGVKAEDKRMTVTVENNLKNTSSVESDSIVLGNDIVVNGLSEGGLGECQYAYLYRRSGDEKWVVGKGYSTDTTYSFKPLKEIDYEVSVKVKDESGKIEEKTFTVAVTNTLKNTSVVAGTSIALGESIVMSGSAEGGSGDYTYQYLCKKSDETKWTVVKDYSTEAEAKFEPAEAGTYQVCVKVKDSNGVQGDSKKFSVSVKNTLQNKSSVAAESIVLGNDIVMNGAAAGGSGDYTYIYYYRRQGTSNWSKKHDYSTNQTEVITPLAETVYEICIKVKDSKGTVAAKYFEVEVKNTLVNTSAVSAETLVLGSTIEMNGSAQGGTGDYQYAYLYRKSDSENWITVQGFTSETTCEFRPMAETTYEICIKVKDAKNITEKKTFQVEVKNTLVNTSTVSTETLVLGNVVVMNGSAEGGAGDYQYAYLYRKGDSENWITVQDFTSDKTYRFKPISDTAYELCIKVKDANDITEKKTFSLEVKNTLVNNSYLDSETVSKGQYVVMHGAAEGGTGDCQYAYYCKKEIDSEWSTIKDYSDETTASFKPGETIYDVCIKVKDSNQIVVNQYFKVTVKSSLENVSSVNSYNINKGGTLTIKTTQASGGSGGYEYKYIYKNANSENFKVIKDFSSTPQASVKLLYEGVYQVWAIVRDSNGAEKGRYFEINVKALKNTAKVSATVIDRGKTLAIKASATGGSGNYRFAFQYRLPNSSQWVQLKDYSTSMNCSLKITEIGLYAIRVMVRDSFGDVQTRNFSVRAVKPVSEEFIETVIPGIINDSMGELEKAQAIHDWLVENYEYDEENALNDTVPETSHTAEGAYQTRKAVCDGYTMSFALLAKSVGLEVRNVLGTCIGTKDVPEVHAWNQVKIDDVWYNVDVTWDDPVVSGSGANSDNHSYRYFLVPDSVIAGDHFPQTKTIACTTPQPQDKIITEYVGKQEKNNLYYCTNHTQIKQAFTKTAAANARMMILIYPTTETNISKIEKTVLSCKPSNIQSAGVTVYQWEKLDGYYRISVSVSK